MFSKKLFSLLAFGMACSYQHAAQAASNKVPLMVYVEAVVPSERFNVFPVGWDHTVPLVLPFDDDNWRLKDVNRQLKVTSTIGDVSARLSAMAILSNGTTSVPLDVIVGNRTLTTQAQTVVTHDNAKGGATTTFAVKPGTLPASGLAVGNYSGVVSVLFESNPAIGQPATP